MYYDDPVLTFEDSMVYGCTLELTVAELDDFCKEDKWKNLMIFQNLFQLEVVGSSGNANPHFSKDWVTIEIDTDKDRFTEPGAKGGAGATQGECSFPSVRVIEVFYRKINTEADPQYIITKMQHYQPKTNKWTFTNPQEPADRK